MNRSIIVVTGTPGTGKTYFTKRVSQLINYNPVYLNDVLINLGFVIDYDAKRRSYIVDIERAVDFVSKKYGKGRYIIESHISHLVVSKNLIKVCVVLRCSPYILWDRLKNRGYDEKKIRENVEAEILDVIFLEAIDKYGKNLVIQLDTSKGVKSAINSFIRMYRDDRFVSEHIDWLTLIYNKGDVARFLI